MCYYNGQKVEHAEFIRLKGLEKLVANYDFLNRSLEDGFAYGNTAVLKPQAGKEDFDLIQMEWGFLPDTWYGRPINTRALANEFRRGYTNPSGVFVPGITTLNAMGEELLLPHKIYRQSALERRCLVLSTNFYEWQHVFPKNKRTGQPLKSAIKIPYYITLKDKPYFYMAGIYKPWTDVETGETIETVTIDTTAAPEGHIMAKIHNIKKRMATILNEDLAYEWIFDKNMKEKRITEIATTVYPSEEFAVHTIAKDFKTAMDPTEPFVYEDILG